VKTISVGWLREHYSTVHWDNSLIAQAVYDGALVEFPHRQRPFLGLLNEKKLQAFVARKLLETPEDGEPQGLTDIYLAESQKMGVAAGKALLDSINDKLKWRR
jgi:hypothetical protein